MLASGVAAGQRSSRGVATFQGDGIRVMTGELDSDGVEPVTPAKVCLERSGQCFTAEENGTRFGLEPEARVVTFMRDHQLLLFTARYSAGGSGALTMIALLDAQAGRLLNMSTGVRITEQGEFTLWTEPAISDAPLLVVADYVAGAGETHFSPHRFRVRSYVYVASSTRDGTGRYVLRDEYVTDRKYPSLDDSNTIDVLAHERVKVVARMSRSR
jgi:hypothetical protein